MTEISGLIRGPQGPLLLHCEDTEDGCQPGSSPVTKYPGTVILDFLVSRTVRNLLFLSLPVYGICYISWNGLRHGRQTSLKKAHNWQL